LNPRPCRRAFSRANERLNLLPPQIRCFRRQVLPTSRCYAGCRQNSLRAGFGSSWWRSTTNTNVLSNVTEAPETAKVELACTVPCTVLSFTRPSEPCSCHPGMSTLRTRMIDQLRLRVAARRLNARNL
jgi:hypothetical protein